MVINFGKRGGEEQGDGGQEQKKTTELFIVPFLSLSFSESPLTVRKHMWERNLGGKGKKDSRRALEVGSSWKLSAEMQTLLDKKAIRSGEAQLVESKQVPPVLIFNALGYRVAHP